MTKAEFETFLSGLSPRDERGFWRHLYGIRTRSLRPESEMAENIRRPFPEFLELHLAPVQGRAPNASDKSCPFRRFLVRALWLYSRRAKGLSSSPEELAELELIEGWHAAKEASGFARDQFFKRLRPFKDRIEKYMGEHPETSLQEVFVWLLYNVVERSCVPGYIERFPEYRDLPEVQAMGALCI